MSRVVGVVWYDDNDDDDGDDGGDDGDDVNVGAIDHGDGDVDNNVGSTY